MKEASVIINGEVLPDEEVLVLRIALNSLAMIYESTHNKDPKLRERLDEIFKKIIKKN